MAKKCVIYLCVYVVSLVLYGGASPYQHEKVIVLEGQYQKKNLFVLNDVGCGGAGFCTFLIKVNGEVTTDEAHMPVFEIDFSALKVPVNGNVLVEIHYRNDDCCSPIVLNPDDIVPVPTCKFLSASLSDDGILRWRTSNEGPRLPFIVEQKRWDKWIFVGEVPGKGGDSINDYQFKVSFVSGLNIFRVKQRGGKGIVRLSPMVSYYSPKPEILWIYNKETQTIEFSEPTYYELYDSKGNILKIGYGIRIETYMLPSGKYYLNYGNTTGKFVK